MGDGVCLPKLGSLGRILGGMATKLFASTSERIEAVVHTAKVIELNLRVHQRYQRAYANSVATYEDLVGATFGENATFDNNL